MPFRNTMPLAYKIASVGLTSEPFLKSLRIWVILSYFSNQNTEINDGIGTHLKYNRNFRRNWGCTIFNTTSLMRHNRARIAYSRQKVLAKAFSSDAPFLAFFCWSQNHCSFSAKIFDLSHCRDWNKSSVSSGFEKPSLNSGMTHENTKTEKIFARSRGFSLSFFRTVSISNVSFCLLTLYCNI